MRRSLTLLLLSLPIWAQFQPAPSQQPYPQDVPGGYPPQYQAQSQYPTQPQAPYPAQQPYPTSPQPQQYPAQQPSQQPYSQDEGRDFAADQQHGVARIRIVQGDVNVKRGDNGMLTGAIMNAPMFSRDHIETGPGSRAEVELDNANVIRVGADTDLGFANLAFGSVQSQLGIGTVIVRVLRQSQTQIEIDTPSVALHPLMPGEYRISVFENGTSQVTVRSGRLEMSGVRGSQNVEQGQTLNVRGDANDPEFQPAYEVPRDQFDDWSTSRDAEMMSSRSAQYVSGDVYGAEDLDRYGNWVPSQYGQVWAPQGVGPDWSPYSNGQWTYADYYGWTWIGYEPWGWAPYHYGRWFYNTGIGWCWWPGAALGFGFHWSPALVGFFGFGGGLGWVSLAPFELFHPWWGRGGGGYYAAFRGGYELQHFRNAGIRGGALTAGYNSFAGAGHRFSIASAGQLRSASIFRGSIPVSPVASSYRFSERSVNSNPRLSSASSRSFFSRGSSSFNNSRAGGVGTFNGSRYSTPSSSNGSGWQRFGSPASSPGSNGGWQHFGSAAPSRPQQSGGNAESGWHDFGRPAAPAYRNVAPSGGNYGSGNYRAPAATPHYSAPAAPHYSAPSAPRYSAPSTPHYSAPKNNGGGGGHPSGGGGGSHSGGGGHGGGGGHHR